MAIKPLKPSKASRNQRKQETRRLLEQQRPPSQAQFRLEDVVVKRLG